MMCGRGQAPVPTEADIRAALVELAQRAPSTDAVLTAVRDARAHQHNGSPRPPGPPRLPGTRWLAAVARWLRWPQLAVAAVAATAAMVLAVVLTLGSAPVRAHGYVVFPPIGSLPREPGTASPGSISAITSPSRDPSTVLVAIAMMAASSAAAGNLVFETTSGFTKGHLSGTARLWNWPATPIPGKLEYARQSYKFLAVGRTEGTRILRAEDLGYTTVVPRSPAALNAYTRLIAVCYTGTGCGYGRRNVAPGTWWMRTGMLGYMDFAPDPGGADLARQIAGGEWRIVGHARLRGQQAIKLAETRTGHFMPRPVFLWVSTATYLPLRMVWLSGDKTGEIDDWYYLPATKANLAQLRVPIPAGYRRSG
jgi:hypothetical protein